MISDRGEISSESLGAGDAGSIQLWVDSLALNDGKVSTASFQGSGGGIQIQAETIRLFENSDITTAVAQGRGSGGNISVVADSFVALDDSDILAFASDGRGGNIDLSQTAFFGENFFGDSSVTESSRFNPQLLDGNGRVDVNATGQLAPGEVTFSDVSFIENDLSELTDDLIDEDVLVANTCIARNDEGSGRLVVTGGDRLPTSPNDVLSNAYTVGSVQPVPNGVDTALITEPQSVYPLSDGRLFVGQNCQE